MCQAGVGPATLPSLGMGWAGAAAAVPPSSSPPRPAPHALDMGPPPPELREEDMDDAITDQVQLEDGTDIRRHACGDEAAPELTPPPRV